MKDMMEKEDVLKQLRFIITDKLDIEVSPEEVNQTDELLEEGLGLDSVAVMELIYLVEEQFNFHFEEDELRVENFQNLQTLAQFIINKTLDPTQNSGVNSMINTKKDYEYWEPSRKGFVTNYPNFQHWKKMSRENIVNKEPLNIYVHIPFCIQRCAYCYYKTINLRGDEKSKRMGKYVDALCREIEMATDYFQVSDRPVISIYFGGGTPTLLTDDQLEQLVSCLRSNLNIEEPEFTIEGEPVTLTQDKAKIIEKINATRISLGIQSFDDHVIKQANRLDTAKKALKAVEIAKSTDKIINIDLMSGLAGETFGSWENSVESAINTGVQSITVYKTELYTNTAYYRGIRRNLLELPSDDQEIEYTKYAIRRLEEEGYRANSFFTFTKNGEYHHVHAPSIFRGADCLSFGVSAFGCLGGWVYQNTNDENKYISMIEEGHLPIYRGYKLTALDKIIRNIVLEIKLVHLNLEAFRENHGFDLTKICKKTIDQLKEEDIISLSEDTLSLTPKGIILGDYAGKSLVKELMEMY